MVAPVTPETEFATNSFLRDTIALGTVTGAGSSASLLEEQVTDTALREALARSLERHGLRYGAGDRFTLDVRMVGIEDRPLFESLTVLGRFEYVMRGPQRQIVFDEIIATPFTPEITASLFGPANRAILAEGSVRASIDEFLFRLRRDAQLNPIRFTLALPQP
ncbi:MAG: hypothetical protein AAF713_04165 [Pseudomonadota bacterium]